MSAAKHAAGGEVFDVEGNVYAYIGSCNGGHAVQAIYEHDDDEPYFSDPRVLPAVFKAPPRQRLTAATRATA